MYVLEIKKKTCDCLLGVVPLLKNVHTKCIKIIYCTVQSGRTWLRATQRASHFIYNKHFLTDYTNCLHITVQGFKLSTLSFNLISSFNYCIRSVLTKLIFLIPNLGSKLTCLDLNPAMVTKKGSVQFQENLYKVRPISCYQCQRSKLTIKSVLGIRMSWS